jgi:hypothetical protein
MSHELVGGWRTLTLQNAVLGITPVDVALHSVGIHTNDRSARAVSARRDLDDAITAYKAGDETNAFAAAADLAEEIRKARRPGRGAAA